MGETIATQAFSFFIFTASGIAIGIFFDVFRILRKSFKTSDFITYIEDILFWLISGLFFIFVLFRFNNGEIRSYVIIGLILGLLLYILTISKYFIRINVTLIIFLKRIVIYPIKIIYKFILKLFKPLSFVVINLRKSFKVFVKNTQNKIVNIKKYKKM